MILKVPVGTLIINDDTGDQLFDLTEDGQKVEIVAGGLGGKGNANFATSVRRAPDFAELGEPGQEMNVRLELKLIADVAIIGYPSVGKSTLISRISNAKPKIADYEFTTLVPNLGVVKVDKTDFVVADIPGLIEGAHEGKGLGVAFLKHIERAKILVHLLDITHDDLMGEFKKLNKELELYSEDLAKKPQIIVFNKIDASIPEIEEELAKEFSAIGGSAAGGKKYKPLFISAVAGEGLDQFLYRLKDEVVKNRKQSMKNEKLKMKNEHKVFRPHLDDTDAKNYRVEKTIDGFRISGKRIEQLAVMTNMAQRGGVFRMQDILKKLGAYREMKKMGGIEGNLIYIGERVFKFIDMD